MKTDTYNRMILLCFLFLQLSRGQRFDKNNDSVLIITSPDENIRYHRRLAQKKSPVAGKRVALLQVHLEGNVGDQMETIPLIKKLYDWGVFVDCYLSGWMPLERRQDPTVVERVKPFVNAIYPNGVQFDHDIRDKNYDLLVVTPGPTVNELMHCISKVCTLNFHFLMHHVTFLTCFTLS